MASTGSELPPRRVLIIVENLPVPFDRRVWSEATTLRDHGYEVSVICPTGKGYEKTFEIIDDIHVFRHSLPLEARGALGYVAEYGAAFFHQMRLALKVWRTRGFDVIHGCNPPDTIWAVALPFKLFGKRYVFDHHDICPELFEAKFQKRGALYGLMRLLERCSFATADVSIATNQSYRGVALTRGRKSAKDVFVVRSGPRLERFTPRAPKPELNRGRQFLLGYVGVIGFQEGLDLFIDSVAHLVHDKGRRDVHSIIVGSGPELEAVKAYAAEQDVADYVEFTGRAPDELLFDVLYTADICVNPDRFNAMNDQSTMNKTMEYMAVGKPMVQFDLKESRYSAREASLYAAPDDIVDFADKIETLLADPARREQMGAFGRKRVVEALSWETSIPALLAAYERVFKPFRDKRRPAETPRGASADAPA